MHYAECVRYREHTNLAKWSYFIAEIFVFIFSKMPDSWSVRATPWRDKHYRWTIPEIPIRLLSPTSILYTPNDRNILTMIEVVLYLLLNAKMNFVSWKLALEDVCYRVIRLSSAKLTKLLYNLELFGFFRTNMLGSKIPENILRKCEDNMATQISTENWLQWGCIRWVEKRIHLIDFISYFIWGQCRVQGDAWLGNGDAKEKSYYLY